MKYILIMLMFLTSTNVFAQTIVVDGDTLKHNGITYRLEGIDAPEYGQKCKLAGSHKTWQCGEVATQYLTDLITGKSIRCVQRGVDDFDRVIATCSADDIEINKHMVEQGLAWAFRKFSQSYTNEEEAAKKQRIGVWQADTQTPWDYRASKWNFAAQEAPEGCPIKGNISKNGRIYHAPWSPWYGRTKISINKGERWFCSEGEALEAGWRAPYWGR